MACWLFFLIFLIAVDGQTPSTQNMDEAVRALAARAGAHLAANETAHVTSRNVSSLSQSETSKAQNEFERALRKRVRNPIAVDVALTISENAHGFLLVAKVRDDVDMASFRIEPVKQKARASIDKKIIWEQEIPILDVTMIEDQILVLDAIGVSRYERRERVETQALGIAMPRDPRGRMEIAAGTLIVHVPGATCRGTSKPLALKCEPGGEFTAARNTTEESGLPAHFSRVHIGSEDFVAEIDGRVHVYDAARKPVAILADNNEELGSDLASTCDATRILATGTRDRESRDSLALYEVPNGLPIRVSDPVEFPGPVTALSSTVAVVRNLSTGRYEAYSLTVDCGR